MMEEPTTEALCRGFKVFRRARTVGGQRGAEIQVAQAPLDIHGVLSRSAFFWYNDVL
jgi:hypothetical protein